LIQKKIESFSRMIVIVFPYFSGMKRIVYSTFVLFLIWMISCTDPTEQTEDSVHTDSLAYQIKTMARTWNQCSPDSVNCTYIQFYYPVFKDLKSPLADSIQALIAHSFDIKSGTEQKLDSAQKGFICEFEESIKGEETSKIPWNLISSLSIAGQNASWICFKESSGGYTGGAHDFGNSQYHILEKSTGKHLHLVIFFDSTGLKKLTRLGESAFCKVRGIGPGQSLEEAGFKFEDNRFFLPENFCFTKEGITFVFNSYEVGPYALGPTEFAIPANQLVNLMKKRKA